MNKMFVGISLAVLVYATSQGTGIRPVFADATGTLPVASAPAKPVISSFSPAVAPVGTLISINGGHFDDVAGVLFGTVHAKFVATDSTQLTAIVPDGATSGLITVMTLAGRTVSAAPFKVGTPDPIVISAMSPQTGSSGTIVRLSGKGFTSAATLTFNGVPGQFVINSDTEITAVVPARASQGPIKVTGLGGTAYSPPFGASD